MAIGPIVIFDKSTLQSLNPDESVWLESLFLTNITPMFFIETLADLETEMRKGRTPEDIVESIANKTPDMSSYPNVHHRRLLAGELAGTNSVEMRGRPILEGGQSVVLGNDKGVLFKLAPETEAFQRWQRHEFFDLERQQAREWRRALTGIDFGEILEAAKGWFSVEGKPQTLSEAKRLAETMLNGPGREGALRLGLVLLGVPDDRHDAIAQRWNQAGKPAIEVFAPYFRHVVLIDLFFYIAVAAGLIGQERKSNKIDMAYLYYLPFCMIFISNDRLHAKTAPLFLRPDQTFVDGQEFKKDLGALDKHYDALPAEVKLRGTMHFASYPPTEGDFLVTKLWDRHLPMWRTHEADAKNAAPPSAEMTKLLMDRIRDFQEHSEKIGESVDSDEAVHVGFERRATLYRGKWRRFPPEVEQ